MLYVAAETAIFATQIGTNDTTLLIYRKKGLLFNGELSGIDLVDRG